MKNNFLIVSEKFTSIQGEGRTIGVKSIFLRLSGCNILCQSENWVCDTIEVWRKGTKTNFEDVFNADEINRMRKGCHLVITGGEPLLHQEKVIKFLKWFGENFKFLPILEFETNGTIMPNEYLLMIVEYWNVSFKLSNSGVHFSSAIKAAVLKEFNFNKNAIFKIVIGSQFDILELLEIISINNLNMNKIWLMPAGSSQKELEATRNFVVQKSIELNFNFSDRLHISLWNKKTGV